MPHPFRFDVVTMGMPTREAWIALAQRAKTPGYEALTSSILATDFPISRCLKPS